MVDKNESNPSEELYKLSSALSSATLSAQEKQENLKVISDKYINSEHSKAGGGAYISLEPDIDGSNCIHLPNFEWSVFRRGYTIMTWIRPNDGIHKLNDSNDTGVLYRISHGNRLGVGATLKQLKHDPNDDILSFELQVQAFSPLPKVKVKNASSSSVNTFPTKTVSVTLKLPTSSYSLLTISHTHPYLKQPQIFIAINHQIQLECDLSFPFSPQNSSSKNNHPENNLPLNNNLIFKNLPISCSMLSIFKEPLIKDKSDIVFANLISDAGPSASIHLCQAGVLVPPVPPQRDATVQPLSKKTSSPISISPSSSSSRRNHFSSSNIRRRPLGTPISVHSQSVELQNYLSRSLLFLYDFQMMQTLTKEKKILSSPCMIQNLGLCENIGWVTNPTLQRKSPLSSQNNLQNIVSTFSVYMDGSCTKHIPSPFSTTTTTTSSSSQQSSSSSSSISSSSLIYTSGLLLSLLLPFHLALFPQEEHRQFTEKENEKAKDFTPLQPKLHSQRQTHLNHLLANNGKYAMDLLVQIANVLEISWYCREDALQTGFIHGVATYAAKLLDELEGKNLDEREKCMNSIEQGLLRIVEVCCGKLQDEDPIRRTSDLALTCVFGLGLNFRLVPYFSTSAASSKSNDHLADRKNLILEHIALGYQHYGDVLREYYSPQTLLDQIQIYLPSAKCSLSSDISNHFGLLLNALLKSSLSSSTHISRSEVDVQACVHALTNTKLGSLISGMTLRVLSGLKSRRLARNLWLGEYPKVIGPVLLSRSVVKGEEAKSNDCNGVNEITEDNDRWREEWRVAFDIFVWLTSIPGSDVQILHKSIGNLLCDSGKAGSLDKCINEEFANNLFEEEHEEEYKMLPLLSPEDRRIELAFLRDAHVNRIRALLPLLPGLVTSLIASGDSPNPKKLKHDIIPVLNTLLGGVDLGLKKLTNAQRSKQQNVIPINNSFFNFANRQNSVDFDAIDYQKIKEWVQVLMSIITLLQSFQVENHTDWIDVDHSDEDVRTKEFHITPCVDLILNAIATLLISSMKIGGQSTVATLHALKSCPHLTRIIYLSLSRCIRIKSASFSESMSAGIARLCVFLEEHPDLLWEERLNWTLTEILQRGREESGWYQITNTTIPVPSKSPQKATNEDEKATLRKKFTQFMDETLIQTSSDIYHTLTDEPSALSSFERGSKLFLPILQPTLRIVLRRVSKISSDVQYSSNKCLLQHVCEEINQSVTAALVGLSFGNARDIGLGCIASLRSSIKEHESNGDSAAVSMLEDLVLKATKELRERHVIERKSKYAAQYNAYVEGNGEEDGENSKLVEQLILGVDSLSEENQDFILYPESLNSKQDKNENQSKAILGWSKYSGLGSTLDACFESGEEINTEIVFDHLKQFLDEWDTVVEMEKADMINLFDNVDVNMEDPGGTEQNHAAGDAAVQYIELSSAEEQRLKEVSNIFSSLIYQCEASASNLCWIRWMEDTDPKEEVSNEWERSVGERGGKDIYSRLGTSWITPQFPKTIPYYLDHTKATSRRESITTRNILDGEFNLGGKVEIVDITKKSYYEDESGKSDDEGSLGFPEVTDIDEVEEEPLIQNDLKDTETKESDKSLSGHQKARHTVSSPFSSTSPHNPTVLSSFSHPPDVTALHEASHVPPSHIEMYCDNILHVRPEGCRKGVLLVTKTHLIIEYYNEFYEAEIMSMEEARNRSSPGGARDEQEMDEDVTIEITKSINTFGRPNSCRFLISEITHAYLRRYRLRDSAIEMFFLSSGGSSSFSGSNSLFVDFGPGAEGNSRRDSSATHIMRRAPQNSLKQFPEKSNRFLHERLQKITLAWVRGSLSNFDYLMQLNILSGRSFNDLCQYPVMPWVLSNYHSDEVPDMNDPDNFRDLTKPMGALNTKRLAEFVERFETFSDPTIPPFMYGSHYSTSAGVVLHFLVRLHPFAGLHRQLQSGHFDVADRLFCNVRRTWETCTGTSASEVKELTPEWYCNPAFLKNSNKFVFGTSQEGEVISDVQLPPWAKGSPEKFIEVMRCAMESNICSAMLPDWIDLIFGYKQQGPESIRANNVFFYLTYYGSIDISAIKDEDLRIATELQIAHFGQCPMQLFWRPHVRKLPLISSRRKECMSHYLNLWSQPGHNENPKLFEKSPISHWVHLAAPPPGPHSDMICVKACLGNRCVGIDDRGVVHFFKWVWKPEEDDSDNENVEEAPSTTKLDRGCFVAQRELSNFRSLPRLPFIRRGDQPVMAVAISSQLYLMVSHLLILSDADGCGGLGLQFVDPKKGVIKTETVIPFIHSSRISAIAMDSIGAPSGKHSKGPSGEVAIVGSDDGTATLWRFIFNSHIPLRPRLRMRGHYGHKILSVAVSCSLNLCATVSKTRCCLFHIGNGALLRTFSVPTSDDDSELTFANTQAICFSNQGYVILVCQSVKEKNTSYSIELFTLEGVHCGSFPLETIRGMPRKITAFAEGKAVCVCSGLGVSIHQISTLDPLKKLEEWRITDQDLSYFTNPLSPRKIPIACDIDFYPKIQPIRTRHSNRPYAAIVACTDGALRIHALPGITKWASENQITSVSAAVGNALVKPAANTIKTAVGSVKGFGTRFLGFGKEIGREVGGAFSSGAVASASGSFVGGILRKAEWKD